MASALRTSRFWLAGLAMLFGVLPNYFFNVHLVAQVVQTGYSPFIAASAFGLTGVMQSLSLAINGTLSDRLGRVRTLLVGSAINIAGILLLASLGNADQPWLLYAASILVGLGFGRTVIFFSTVADLFQGRSLGAINGIANLLGGIGMTAGPWIGGVLFDWTGRYQIALYLMIGSTLIALTMLWLAAPSKVRGPATFRSKSTTR